METIEALGSQYAGMKPDELAKELKKLPFFMSDQDDLENNDQIEALKAMAYEGEPHEIAENFRQQGNECFREKKYKDAREFYTRALDQDCKVAEITIACLGNRAQANLEMKNYRQCCLDCASVLEMDAQNVKAWFRTGKAMLALDKVDQAMACCDQGLAVDNKNAALKALKGRVLEREAKLKELERKRELVQQKKNALKLALEARAYTNKNTANDSIAVEHELSDPVDAESELYVPILALYPMAMQSDIIQKFGDFGEVGDIVEQLFSEPPDWATADYCLGNLDVFFPTDSGSVVKVGLDSKIIRALQIKHVVMVDNMVRMYIVPRNQVAAWRQKWDAEAQRNMFI